MANVSVVGSTGYKSAGSSQFIFNNLGSSGDLGVAFFCHRAIDTMNVVPTGWNVVDPPTINGGGSADPFLRTYMKQLGSGESTSFTFEKDSGTGGGHVGVVFLRDHNTANLSTGEVEADTATSTAHTVPNTTAPAGSGGGCALACVAAFQTAGTNSWTTTSAGWTKGWGDIHTAGTLRASIGVFYSTNISTGTITGIKCNGTAAASGVVGALIISPSIATNPASRYQYHQGQIQT